MNATRKSPGNPVEFKQSDDDFERAKVFKVCFMHQTFSQWSVCLTSEVETLSKLNSDIQTKELGHSG